jgi:tRNA nucleotidyltransferase (CCA-adding enzyme)
MKLELLHRSVAAAYGHAPRLDPVDRGMMTVAVECGVIEQLSPAERWCWLGDGLMGPRPGSFLWELHSCNGLARLLPELAALFGVPQLSDAAEPVDVGVHQLRLVDELAKLRAPLPVRFAALVHKIGKGATPREIWPSHFNHEQRGQELLEQLCTRIAVPADALALARLVIEECDRVHRASDMRAGALVALLTRVRALEEPARFEQLLSVCTCDYATYEGHSAHAYPKANRLRRALAACAQTFSEGLSSDDVAHARAEAVARSLSSVRFSPSY